MILVFVLLYAFILFADALKFIPAINYWDEVFAVAIPVIVIIKNILLRKFSFDKYDLKQLGIIFIVILLGLAGNVLHPGIQSNIDAVVKDILAYLKFPMLMVFLRTATYDWSVHKKEIIVKWCNYISKINIVVASVFAVVGYFINIGVYTNEIRYVKCYKFVFSHPTFLVANLVFCISMLILENKQKNKYYIFAGCVLLFMTQRNKAYAALALILIIMLIKKSYMKYFFSFRWKTKLKAKNIIPISLIIITIMYTIFYNKFEEYLEWGMTTARMALSITSLIIANDYFPFGAGFGTYASSLSGKYYSNIYYMYNLYSINGMRIDEYNYISDTFWPWVLGEFGFIAMLIYIYLFFCFISNQFIRIKKHERLLAFIILWFYSLLASTMESYFTNTTGVTFALILSLYVGVDSRMYKRSGKKIQVK